MSRKDTSGTITSRETKDVFRDVLIARKVPSGLWSFKGRHLHMLVGSRLVEVPCGAGSSFYGMTEAVRRLEAIIDEVFRARAARNQIDLEDLIGRTPVREAAE